MTSDWSDELESDSVAFSETMRERLIVTHASMDDWSDDFLQALARHDLIDGEVNHDDA